MRIRKSKTPAVCSRSVGSFKIDEPCMCTVSVQHEDIKSATVHCSNVPTDCNLMQPKSQLCETECPKCARFRNNVYENAYECKINGGSVRFIQRVCLPPTCKQTCQNSNVEQSQPVEKVKTPPKSSDESAEHSYLKQSLTSVDKKQEVLVQHQNKALAKDKVVMQKENKTVIEEISKNTHTFSSTEFCLPNTCEQVCQNSTVKQFHLVSDDKPVVKPKGDIEFTGKNVEHPSLKQPLITATDQTTDMLMLEEMPVNDKVVIEKYKKPEKKKSLAKKSTCSSIGICCKGSQNAARKQSQLVDSDKPPTKPKNNYKFQNRDVKQPSPKESLLAVYQNQEELILKKQTLATGNVVSNACLCRNLHVEQKKLAKDKIVIQKNKKPEKEEIVTKTPECALTGIYCEPNVCKDCQASIVRQSQLDVTDKPPAKPEGDSKFQSNDLEQISMKESLIAADQNHELLILKEKKAEDSVALNTCLCQNSQVEQFELFGIDKSQIKGKGDAAFNNKNLTHKLVDRNNKQEREKVITKSSSIGICDPSICKVCQNSIVEQYRLVDNEKPAAKPRGDFENKSIVYTSPKAADQNQERLKMKDNMIIEKDSKLEREKYLTKGSTSPPIGICKPDVCKLCENSFMNRSQLIDNNQLPPKPKGDLKTDEEPPSSKESRATADQDYEPFTLKDKTLVDDKMASDICVCKNANAQQFRQVDKPLAKPKDDTKFDSKRLKHKTLTEDKMIIRNEKDIVYPSPKQSLIAKDQNHELLILRDKKVAKDKVVIEKNKKSEREKYATKRLAPSSVRICKPDLCKVCQKTFKELSQLVGNDELQTKQKSDLKNDEESSESLTAADKNHEPLISKETTLVEGKVTSVSCLCKNSYVQYNLLVDNDKLPAKSKGDNKLDNKSKKHKKPVKEKVVIEKDKVVEYPSPKQSLIAKDQNHELLILRDKKLTKNKMVIARNKKPERGKYVTKGNTSSSIGTCKPSVCKVCQNSFEEQPQLIDKVGPPIHEPPILIEAEVASDVCLCRNSNAEQFHVVDTPSEKLKDDTKFDNISEKHTILAKDKVVIQKEKDTQYPSPKQSLVAKDQNHELLILKDKPLAKDEVVIERSTSFSLKERCSPNVCKDCQDSFVQHQLSEYDKSSAKEKGDFKLEKEVLIAADQHHVPLILKEKTLADDKTVFDDCVCNNWDVEQFHPVDRHKPLTNANDEIKFEYKDVECNILTKNKVLIQKDKETQKEKGLTNKPVPSLTDCCDFSVCKMYQGLVVDDANAPKYPENKFKFENKDVEYLSPKESIIAKNQSHELLILKGETVTTDEIVRRRDKKPEQENTLTNESTTSSIEICEPNACKVNVCEGLVEEQSQLIGTDITTMTSEDDFETKNAEQLSPIEDLIVADENHEVLIRDGKTQNKEKMMFNGCACQNSDREEFQMVINDALPTEPQGVFEFTNKDVEHPSPKQSLSVVGQIHEKFVLKDVALPRCAANVKDKAMVQKKKKQEGERNLKKRPTFSSIGFLIKHLERYTNPRLTKAEVAKYNKRKRQCDRASAGELPTFGFYGTKEKKIFNFGERGVRTKGEVQDFYKLRDYHLSTGTLFEDPEFPAIDSSLFYSKRPERHYEWKRPGELVENPRLFVNGYSRFDVQQGELGDCWLLSAAANLTLHRKLFFQVVPTDQDFDKHYAGIFHFRFWQYGIWIDVVIDDRLPTYNGQLIFLHSTEGNEFWSALLEKAYAKLHGSYEALDRGNACEAMQDFTGGVTEMYELSKSPTDLFRIIFKSYERCSLMSCSIKANPDRLEAITADGLVRGHAYSITKVQYVDIRTPSVVGKIPLLRLRNPWGNNIEWSGAWSDKSPEWRFISDEEKEKIGLTFDDDGEFWMSFKDFVKHFDDLLEICHLAPDFLTEEELMEEHKKKWETSVFEGEWVRGVTAGGCINFLDTFWMNPQYRVTLRDPDDDDGDNRCTMIVALMQKNRRVQRKMGVNNLSIGFEIYYINNPNQASKHLDINFFSQHHSVTPVDGKPLLITDLREISNRFRLPPGTYCIVPSTYNPDEEGEFILRVLSEHKNNMEENDEEFQMVDVDDTIKKHITTAQETKDGDRIKELFFKVAGRDMEVDWMELKQLLDHTMRSELSASGFSKDICRSMVAMLDADRSGKLGFAEFEELWVDVCKWRRVFKKYDKDNSGTLSGAELRKAFRSAGYHLNNHLLNILMHRYGNNKRVMEFDDFIMCAVKLKTMARIFKDKDTSNTNAARFNLEQWMENTVYA